MGALKLPAVLPAMKEDADGYTKLPNQILEGLIPMMLDASDIDGCDMMDALKLPALPPSMAKC